MMQTPGPGDRQQVMGDFAGMDLGPDPSGTAGTGQANGGRMPLALPAQAQSWGLQNPTLPNQLQGWLRNYYGGVGSLHQDVLEALVQAAKAGGGAWNTTNADFGHGNAGLPDGGANLPADPSSDQPTSGVLAGMGTGPARYGGSNDLSEPQPTWLGTVDFSTPDQSTWGQSLGAHPYAS
jgi:hypothetical protein